MSETKPRGRRDRRPGRPSGGARSRTSSSACPFITRTMTPFEVLSEEGLATDRAQRRHDPRDRSASTSARRPEALRDARRTAARGRRRARAVPARPGPHGSSRRPRRASSSSTRATRRTTCRSAARTPCSRRRTGRRSSATSTGPALRHDRGLPQLREARVHDAVPASLRRHGLRAGRPAGEQAALRHGVRAHAVLGQAVHGLGHAPAARAGHGRHGADPVRRRRARGAPVRDEPDQRELARSCGTRRCSAPRAPTPRRTRP